MKNSIIRQTLGAAVSISAIVATGIAHGADFEWPRLLVIGTPGTNSGSFASTNGWAPVLQKEVGMTVRIVPEENEPMRYRRLTERKDIAISSVSAAEMRFQIEGIGGYSATIPAEQRLLWHHNDTPWGFVVSGESKLKTVDDLKPGGMRIAQGVFSPPMVMTVNAALPAFIGLSEQEAQGKFTYVPASSYGENCRSVVESKADVAYCAPISSVLSEMEGAPGGIRWLEMPLENKEAWDRFLKYRPMLIPTKIDLGVATAKGVAGITSNFVYTVPASANVDFVYNMAKWMHKSFDAYKGTHPLAARMALDKFREYLDRSPLPVHDGTVKYLREIGAWTEKDDVWNKKATAQMESWVKARKTVMDEARKAGVKIDFKDEAFLAIHKKHTEGLEGFKTRL